MKPLLAVLLLAWTLPAQRPIELRPAQKLATIVELPREIKVLCRGPVGSRKIITASRFVPNDIVRMEFEVSSRALTKDFTADRLTPGTCALSTPQVLPPSQSRVTVHHNAAPGSLAYSKNLDDNTLVLSMTARIERKG